MFAGHNPIASFDPIVKPVSFLGNDRKGWFLGFRVLWGIRCTKGRLNECRGEIDVLPPPGTDITAERPKKGRIDCKGSCNRQRKTVVEGQTLVRFTSEDSLDQDARSGRSLPFRLKFYCLLNGKRDLVRTVQVRFAFGFGGTVDKGESDLDGDFRPDRDR